MDQFEQDVQHIVKKQASKMKTSKEHHILFRAICRPHYLIFERSQRSIFLRKLNGTMNYDKRHYSAMAESCDRQLHQLQCQSPPMFLSLLPLLSSLLADYEKVTKGGGTIQVCSKGGKLEQNLGGWSRI